MLTVNRLLLESGVLPLLEYTVVFASDVVDVDMKEAEEIDDEDKEAGLFPVLDEDEDADDAEVDIEEDRLLEDEDGEDKSSFKFIAVNTDVGLAFGFLYQLPAIPGGGIP